ncbi:MULTISPECIES: arsenate reductase/protein-tyrosine-phosphatase family protein [Providencia]|uniref:arsenate reductase/protein-tyrosine-phosphatase family protein n=1 Tax=Providencia TaxID=586 RepID=UPI0015EBCB5A|nr:MULTISPECIES: protein tyrosine phosphatase [Providencia]ELR5139258.1 protein tyrosine phosphatase [Providencia rettgeri]ELR5169851.1 protein tyrosine phosphatase [Providencia rettgeri]ELR5257554.1 protein tyrosine phosphatase [Providencia rettgeri]MBQ0440419.1 protein tyrosine phosphatase [Providencia rettgeri]MBX6969481.1 protein tyrosine phosphatase [Providencia rettgeri]
MFNNILVVCMGNICRSPTGERLLQQYFPEKTVHSAGIIAKNDRPAYDSAIRIAQQHSLSLENHQSRRLTSELCKKTDLILVMENDHIAKIHQLFPETRGKVMLFGQWINKTEIPDPHKRSDEMFEHVYQLMEKAAIAWQGKI